MYRKQAANSKFIQRIVILSVMRSIR